MDATTPSGSTDSWRERLSQALESGAPDEALRILEAATAAAPDDAEAWASRGALLLRLGRHEEALAPLARVTDLAAEDPDAWLLRARAHRAAGQLREAADAFARAAALDATRPEAWIGLGDAWLELGDAARALEALDQAVQADPRHAEHAEILLLRGAALNGLARYAEALAVVDRAIQLVPPDKQLGLPWLHKGVALNGLGRHAEALEALERASKLFAEGPEQGFVWLHRAVALNELGRHAEALEAVGHAERLVPDGPYRGVVLLQKGIAYNALGQPDAAVEVLEGALDRIREDSAVGKLRPAVQIHRGTALNSLGRHAEALEALRSGLDVIHDASPVAALRGLAWLQTALALSGLGRPGEALEALDRALALWPPAVPRTGLLVGKADLLKALGRPEEALESLAEASRLDPQCERDLRCWLLRSDALLSLGRADEVVASIAPELEAHPLTQAIRGTALMFLGRTEEAWSLLSRAAEPRPDRDEPRAWLGVGLACVSMARAAEAVEALDRACALEPRFRADPLVLLLRSVSLVALARHRDAWEAIETAPDRDFTLLIKGMALAGLGQEERALEAFDRSIDLAAATPATHDFYATFAWIQKGFVLLGQKRNGEALEAFGQAGQHAGRRPAGDLSRFLVPLGTALALDRLGRSEEALGQLAEATRLSEALPRTFPNRGMAWWARGELLASLERDEEALHAFDRAERLEPENVDVLLGKGNALLRLEDYEAAVRTFTAAAAGAREDAARYRAHLGKGVALSRLERYELAVEAYREAQVLASPDLRDSWKVWVGLGEVYSAMGRHQAALRAYQQGWRMDRRRQRSAELAIGIGASLLDQKRDAEALEFLAAARDQAEPDPRIDYNLGVALYRLGQTEQARTRWEAAKGVARAREYLDELDRRASRSGAWLDYWFGAGSSPARGVIGGALLGLTAFAAMVPLLQHTGRDWRVTGASILALLVLLILPTLRGLSVGPLKLEPAPSLPEARLGGESGMDALIGRMRSIGPSLTVGTSVQNRLP